MSEWQWLIDICVQHGFRFAPSKDGEPWVEYAAIAHLTKQETSQIERKFRGLRRHPAFAGLVQWTDLEQMAEGNQL